MRKPLSHAQLVVFITITATGTIMWFGFLVWLAVRVLRWVF